MKWSMLPPYGSTKEENLSVTPRQAPLFQPLDPICGEYDHLAPIAGLRRVNIVFVTTVATTLAVKSFTLNPKKRKLYGSRH